MSRIAMEKKAVTQMISLYCKKNHNTVIMCDECKKLNTYALAKLDCCPFDENKGFCSKCATHCYDKKQREQIRKVMRFSGPRMILHNPKVAIMYLMQKFK